LSVIPAKSRNPLFCQGVQPKIDLPPVTVSAPATADAESRLAEPPTAESAASAEPTPAEPPAEPKP